MSDRRPIIYFDIDNTLIDTSKLVSLIALGLEEIGISKAVFESVTEEYYQQMTDPTDFNQQQLIGLLMQRSGKHLAEIESVFFNPDYFEEAIFPEVIPTLENLQPKFKLGTFSQGNLRWQTDKLRLSQLERFFEPSQMVIEKRKLSHEALLRLEKNSVVIDDKVEVVTILSRERTDLKVIWIHRNNDEIPETIKNLPIVTKLTEMIALI